MIGMPCSSSTQLQFAYVFVIHHGEFIELAFVPTEVLVHGHFINVTINNEPLNVCTPLS